MFQCTPFWHILKMPKDWNKYNSIVLWSMASDLDRKSTFITFALRIYWCLKWNRRFFLFIQLLIEKWLNSKFSSTSKITKSWFHITSPSFIFFSFVACRFKKGFEKTQIQWNYIIYFCIYGSQKVNRKYSKLPNTQAHIKTKWWRNLNEMNRNENEFGCNLCLKYTNLYVLS